MTTSTSDNVCMIQGMDAAYLHSGPCGESKICRLTWTREHILCSMNERTSKHTNERASEVTWSTDHGAINVHEFTAYSQGRQASGAQPQQGFAHRIARSKNPKSLSKTPKRHPNGLQIHAWRPPESPKTSDGCLEPKKIEFRRLGTSKNTLKELQIWSPGDSETAQNEASKPSA